MNTLVEKYYKKFNDVIGDPQEYKNILFYPLLLKDFEYYTKLNMYFTLSKHHVPDKDIIKMSMLKFILYIYQPQINLQLSQNNQSKINAEKDIIDLFKFIIKPKKGVIKEIHFSYLLRNPNDNIINNYCDLNFKINVEIHIIIEIIHQEIIEVIFTEQDFEDIREILLEQNGISLDYINQYDPSLEDNLIFFQKTMQPATFEEQIFSFGEVMKKHTREICETYTFYQYKKYIDRRNIRKNYEMFKPLEQSGQISIKNGTIEHWLSHLPDKGRYDDILVKKEDYVRDNDIFKASQVK